MCNAVLDVLFLLFKFLQTFQVATALRVSFEQTYGKLGIA